MNRIRVNRRSTRGSLIAVLLGLFLLGPSFDFAAGSDGSPESEDSQKKKKKKSKKKKSKKKKSKKSKKKESTAESTPKKALSINELYVRDTLKEYLLPTSLSFLDDGRVRLRFDFKKKNPHHENIFIPRVQTRINSHFRWSVRGEEEEWEYYGYDFSRNFSRDDVGGLRVSNVGMAILNCWFKNDVTAEITYFTGTSSIPSRIVSVVFCNKSGAGLGSNLGSQCVYFKKASPGRRKGSLRPLNIYTSAKITLVVKEDNFAAHRDGRKQAYKEYTSKKFASGRVGFVWGGKAMGMISELVITGTVDAERMAKELRKVMRKKRR